MKTTAFLKKVLINMPGWRTKRKILLIESDDWGAIRTPSKEAYLELLASGIPVDRHYFAKNDCLESNDDLVALFEVLSRHKDHKGQPAVITANAVVANPDFDKIAAMGKTEYHYQLISKTYDEYPNHGQVMDLWKRHGIAENMLWPQFHGREHLNVHNWLKAINSDSEAEQLAFKLKALLSIKVPSEPVQVDPYVAAFEYFSESHKAEIEAITRDGLLRFEELFGFSSRSFIASCSIQGEHIDPVLKEMGVEFHQHGQQFRPTGNGGLKKVNMLWGQRNASGQLYWRRNGTFEPSRNQDYDWVGHCLKEIEAAFMTGKPAVLNSHRVNFSGTIFPENREKSLKQLDRLLAAVLKKWPEVEFMNSQQLGDIIKDSK